MQHHLAGYVIAGLLILSGVLIHTVDWESWMETREDD